MNLFVAMIVISTLCGVEVDLFAPSLPEIRHYFGLSNFMVQLLLSVNFVAYCIFSLFAGALGDRFNRRHIILLGLWLFVIGSILCVFAGNFTLLLIGRCLQGMGAACPFALLFAELIDSYPREKHAGLIALMNGVTTVAMAFAPVIGSYVNVWFDWRGNFTLLLILGVVSLVMGHFTLPQRSGDPSVNISAKAYLPLLKSPQLMTLILGIGLLIVPYWVFIGMSPILYIEGFKVSLQHFGLYQGAIAAAFAILSFLSPKILAYTGQRRCLFYGLILLIISVIFILGLTVTDVRNPLSITLVMIFLSISVLFPLTLLFPLAVEILPNAKGRSTALILAIRLILTAIFLQTVSYFYRGSFVPIGMAMLICLILFLLAVLLLYRKQWIVFGDESHLPS